MSTILSPGVSEQQLARALEGFAAAVGSEHVLTGEAELREFRDPFAFATWDDYTASAVVMPETGRGGPGDRPDRQRAQGPAVDASARAATTATAAPRRGCAAP